MAEIRRSQTYVSISTGHFIHTPIYGDLAFVDEMHPEDTMLPRDWLETRVGVPVNHRVRVTIELIENEE